MCLLRRHIWQRYLSLCRISMLLSVHAFVFLKRSLCLSPLFCRLFLCGQMWFSGTTPHILQVLYIAYSLCFAFLLALLSVVFLPLFLLELCFTLFVEWTPFASIVLHTQFNLFHSLASKRFTCPSRYITGQC